MTTFQKIVKAAAIALAIFIIFTIVSTILSITFTIFGGNLLFNLIGQNSGIVTVNEEKIENVFDIEQVRNLNINTSIENIEILRGENEFRVVAENISGKYKCDVTDETLNIQSKVDKKVNINGQSKIKIYIPKDFVFDSAKVKLGLGDTDIESLAAQDLSIECGTGKLDIKYLEAQESCDISCGVGKVDIQNANLSNLQLEAGVGKLDISSALKGQCDIEAGVGELNFRILEFNEEDSKILIDKGIGAFNVNGKSTSLEKIGNGTNTTIKIEGGVGAINLEY